jgi:hypothetical protein
VQLAPVEEHVGQQIGGAVEKAARTLLLHVGDQLEKVGPPPGRLAIPLHLHPEHVQAGAFPEQIHTAMPEARVLLDVVHLRARSLAEEEAADERHGPVRGVLHGLDAVGARQSVRTLRR